MLYLSILQFFHLCEKNREFLAVCLDALYVDPVYARRGVGTSLLRFVEDILRRRGVSVIRADASWNAEDFYIRRGYEPLGPRPPDDARPMRKRLLDEGAA